jgi:hypothetical protein
MVIIHKGGKEYKLQRVRDESRIIFPFPSSKIKEGLFMFTGFQVHI